MSTREVLIDDLNRAQRALKAFDYAAEREKLRTDEPPKLLYPRLLYKGEDTLVVKDLEGQDAALALGWSLTQAEALPPAVEPVAEPKKAKKA